jgi:hypothetical protein
LFQIKIEMQKCRPDRGGERALRSSARKSRGNGGVHAALKVITPSAEVSLVSRPSDSM